jgi:tRNA threonylcarbamoyl adenosine modification protein YeaZ
MKRGHAEALMPLIARVIKVSGIGFAGLDRIAVTTGPGSFTGLRVGLSAARGIALAADKPVVGVTTLAAYAAPIVNEGGEHPVISAIDARHDHVYLQVVAGNGSSLLWPRLAPIEEALDAARFGAPYLVGNAAKILAERWPTDAPAPIQADAQAAPPSVPIPRRRGRIICARPTQNLKRTCCGRPRSHPRRDRVVVRSVGRRARDRAREPARRAKTGAASWCIVSSRLGRSRIRADAG